MNVRALLEDLRGQDVLLEADGNRLVVDAPAEVVTEELRATLAACKPSLLKILIWEQRKLEEAGRRGLVIRWSEYPDWIELHDPLSGEWHEVSCGMLTRSSGERQLLQEEERSQMSDVTVLSAGGPKTEAGKAVVRWNTTRHGISSPALVVSGLEKQEVWK